MGCCACRVPRRLQSVPLVLIVALIVWLYASFVRFAQPSLRAYGATIGEFALVHVLVGLVAAALAQTLLSQRSFLPRHRGRQLEPPPDDATVVEAKANGARRYCRRCRIFKPDRAHHCSSCGRCVLKMDHHCALLNKCIGYYNYKFFLQFVGWSSVACLYIASLVLRFNLFLHLDHAVALFMYGRLRVLSPSLQIVLVFFMSACLGAALFCFLCMHLFFTARNYTTLEYCEKRRDGDYTNYYHLGVFANLQQVFGTTREFLYWLVPMATPSAMQREASVFPVNQKFGKDE